MFPDESAFEVIRQSLMLGGLGIEGGWTAGPRGLRLPREARRGCLGIVAADDASLCWFTWPAMFMARPLNPRKGCDGCEAFEATVTAEG